MVGQIGFHIIDITEYREPCVWSLLYIHSTNIYGAARFVWEYGGEHTSMFCGLQTLCSGGNSMSQVAQGIMLGI